MSSLGCAAYYSANVRGIGNEGARGDLVAALGTGASRVKWQRRINNWSGGEVEFPLSACCDEVGDIRTIAQRLHLARDGEPVWAGVVRQVRWSRDRVKILAGDELWWLQRQIAEASFSTTAELTDAALQILGNNIDRRGYNLTAVPTSVVAEMFVNRFEFESVFEELQDLSRLGLDFTQIVSELRIGRDVPARDGGPIRFPDLSTNDFSSGVEIVEHGELSATRVVVLGPNGSVGIASAQDGVPEYLWHTVVLVNPQVLTNRAAQRAAEVALAERWPPPMTIEMSGNATLVQTAPVCIEQLIPGAVGNVRAEFCGRTIESTFRIAGVDGIWDERGERVQVDLAPVGDTDG